jgi:hypothetical protein
MKKIELMVALSVFVYATPTHGFEVELRPIPEAVARADNACAAAATEIITGMRSKYSLAENIQTCRTHPLPYACNSTRDFVKETNDGHYVPPEFTCPDPPAK